ncbi:MAG: PKD domain-containing protein [Caldilineaceae bacterium]
MILRTHCRSARRRSHSPDQCSCGEQQVQLHRNGHTGGAAQPVTYTWQADGQTPITQSGVLVNSVTYLWAAPGEKQITVTATNGVGTVSQRMKIVIGVEPPQLFLPVVRR